MAAADDYCNMDAVTNGAVSGRLSEWPVLRSECRRAIGEIDTLRAALAAERAKVERLEAEVRLMRAATDTVQMEVYKHSVGGTSAGAAMRSIQAAMIAYVDDARSLARAPAGERKEDGDA